MNMNMSRARTILLFGSAGMAAAGSIAGAVTLLLTARKMEKTRADEEARILAKVQDELVVRDGMTARLVNDINDTRTNIPKLAEEAATRLVQGMPGKIQSDVQRHVNSVLAAFRGEVDKDLKDLYARLDIQINKAKNGTNGSASLAGEIEALRTRVDDALNGWSSSIEDRFNSLEAQMRSETHAKIAKEIQGLENQILATASQVTDMGERTTESEKNFRKGLEELTARIDEKTGELGELISRINTPAPKTRAAQKKEPEDGLGNH